MRRRASAALLQLLVAAAAVAAAPAATVLPGGQRVHAVLPPVKRPGQPRQPLPPAGERAYTEAQRLHAVKDLEGAMEMYARVLDTDPDHIESLYLRANLLSFHGRRAEAVPLYKRCLRAAPSFLPQYVDLALTLGEDPERRVRVRSAKVLQRLFAMRETKPNDTTLTAARHAEARLLYCRTLESLGMHEEALRCNALLAEVIAVMPVAVDVPIATGRILERLGRPAEALVLYRAQIAEQEDPRNHAHAARALNSLGRHAEALPHLRRVEDLERARGAPLAATNLPPRGEALAGAPPGTAAAHDGTPHVAVLDGFATPAECAAVAALLDRAEAWTDREAPPAVCVDPFSRLYSRLRAERHRDALYTRYEDVPRERLECFNASRAFLEASGLAAAASGVAVPPASEPALDRLEARLEASFSLPPGCGDLARVERVAAGAPAAAPSPACNEMYHENDRVVEVFVVLEAPAGAGAGAGGELVFPALGSDPGAALRVPARVGQAVVLWSTCQEWFCEPRSAHYRAPPAAPGGRVTVLRKPYRRSDLVDASRLAYADAERRVAGPARPFWRCDDVSCVESVPHARPPAAAATARAAAAATAGRRRGTPDL